MKYDLVGNRILIVQKRQYIFIVHVICYVNTCIFILFLITIVYVVHTIEINVNRFILLVLKISDCYICETQRRTMFILQYHFMSFMNFMKSKHSNIYIAYIHISFVSEIFFSLIENVVIYIYIYVFPHLTILCTNCRYTRILI